MYEVAASCKDIYRAAVTNWERLQDTVRRETRGVGHLLRYGVAKRGNVTGCQFSLQHRNVSVTC